MSRTKKDRKIQPNSGRTFPAGGGDGRMGAGGFAAAIAAALRREYGGTRTAIKTIATLTGANERAVKNWFGGHNGPSGEFLIALCRHSDQVLETVLLLAGRDELVTAKKFADAKGTLRRMIAMLDDMEERAGGDRG
ncbi:MAG: hypothetical protein J0H94_09225 [Rhizobiales bacterium]|nr:hypothetical protein [Hyphomicrobiales bacterium]